MAQIPKCVNVVQSFQKQTKGRGAGKIKKIDPIFFENRVKGLEKREPVENAIESNLFSELVNKSLLPAKSESFGIDSLIVNREGITRIGSVEKELVRGFVLGQQPDSI